MMSTPRIVPRIVPSPPDNDAPPTMVAAMTSSSRPRPVRPACPLGRKARLRMPANAASAPIRTKAQTHRVDMNARNARRLGAAADSENAKAEVRHRQDEPRDCRHDDEENELHRNDAEEIALPHELEGAEPAFGRAIT